jgi:hypothetical protein
MKQLRILFLSCFGIMLLLPLTAQLIGWKERTVSFENKALAAKPVLSLQNLDPFPVKYEKYYNDYFPARNSLIFGYTYISAILLHKSPVPNLVTIGDGGWVYLNSNELNVFTGKLRFDSSDLRSCLEEIKYRMERCRLKGAEYRLVIIPSKFTVYPEHLPAYIHKYAGKNATDQLIDYLRANSGLKILDLRDTLVADKKKGELWLKGDNHWNELGTYYACESLIRWLAPDYHTSKIRPLQEFRVVDTLVQGGNLIGMMGLNSVWKNTQTLVQPLHPFPAVPVNKRNYPCPTYFGYCWEYELPMQNRDTTLPGMVVIRESFGNELFRNLLASNFGRTTFIWDNWEHKLNDSIVQVEKPKLVLCEVMEGFIDCFLMHHESRHPDTEQPGKITRSAQ